ncbi:MAG: hypothetical protein RLZZ546_1337 [Bacteroidota bacterium]
MKNIHVLPTDKSSIFFITNKGEYYLTEFFVPDTMQTFKNHNIYITSDEGLKEDDWFLDTISNTIHQAKQAIGVFNTRKKIILTTDLDLITHGVQQIDIEFLEWFVKNPSCEFVWTDYDLYSPLGRIMDPHTLEQNLCGGKWKYIISIPQEEPKQSVQEYEQQGMEKYSHELETQTTEQLPTKWFKTEEIETWIGESLTTQGKEIEELNGGKGRLIVLHQCGENKEELISQLETMIYGLKEGFDMFAN